MSRSPPAAPAYARPASLDRLGFIARCTDPRAIAFGLGLLLLAAIWTTTAILIQSAFDTAQEKTAATTRELALTYEAHALRALREIDHTLRTVKYAYDAVGETDALADLKERDLLPPELLFDVHIANSAGLVVASTRAGALEDVSHEDFFLTSQARAELFIAAPRREAASGEWKLLFSRRLDRRDGSFAGIAIIATGADFFASSYETAALGRQGLLALLGADDVVRVHRVGDAVSSGETLDWETMLAHSNDGDRGGALALDALDGVERFLSTRRLGEFPVAVIVGLSRDEQLAAVGTHTRNHLLVASLGSLLLVGVITALARMSFNLVQIRRREQQTRLGAARQSGMAEIATSVLHNVGNALNSVNVSATLVAESFEKSKLAGLNRIVALIREQGDRLGEFLTHDARGKQLPAYLYQLNDALQADRAASLTHLTTLRDSVEHIRKIVMMQQMLARPSAVAEQVDLIELMEASLQMNVDALGRHSVKVIREFEQVPLIYLDKHTVLQIIVNLISNAKHACSESGRADRLITLAVRKRADAIELSVADNGVGIPTENLTRIFHYGFTTRTTGHGFGLHSSALAAKELGGLLRAHSDGVGCGATFTLAIPFTLEQAIR